MTEDEVNEVVAHFQWVQPEYARTIRHGVLNRILINMYVMCALMLFSAILLSTIGTPGAATFLYALFGIYLVLSLTYRIWLPSRMWKKGLGIQEPLEVSVSDRGVSTKSNAVETKSTWDAYLFAEEWKNYYFLKRTKRFATLTIPKRAFDSQQDEVRFRELLRTHTKVKLATDFESEARQLPDA